MPDGKVLILEDDQSLASTYDEIIASLTGKERVVVHSVAELRERLDDALGCAPAILDVDLGEGLLQGSTRMTSFGGTCSRGACTS